MSLNYVTVTGTFEDGSGNPIPLTGQTAYCLFTPSTAVYASGIPLITPAQPIQAPIIGGSLKGESGGGLTLLATDNTGVTFGGLTGFFYWTVTFVINGQSQPSWSFFLPHAPSPVDLSALANTAAGSSGFMNPMTTLGDMISGGASGAAARLPGNATAAREFLVSQGSGGVAQAPFYSALQSGDLPPFTPAQIAAAYPWQFLPESYGAKRNGAFLYDAAMTSGSAVLTTAGLPAPAAPGVSNSGTGGTVLAGTYQVKVTYVNRFGETLGSSASSTTTAGSTSAITVTSPAPWTNATAYYVYCTQAGGATFTRQQAAGSPTPLRTSYVISAPPSSGGANPPASNTSNSAPFSSADVGKAIIVPSAGGFVNVPLVTTILSFQSATQVTLAANATRTVTGNGAVYGTDDTAAIQACINAAVAYAQTAGSEQGTGEVLFSPGIYCIAGALTGTYQNAQITLPYVDSYAGPKVNLKLTGPQEATGPVHWEQPNPPADGATLASIYYSDSGSPPTPYPAVIGGPVSAGGVFFGGNGGLFSNMRVIVDGLNVLVAYRPSINGLDLFGVAQADIRSFSYFGMAATVTAAGGWPPYVNGANPSPWAVTAYRTPTTGNNAQNDLDRLTAYGPWNAVVFADHFCAQSIKAVFCNFGATGGAPQASHHCTIASLCAEVGSAALFCDNSSFYGGSTVPVHVASLNCESVTNVISDPGNLLYGDVHAEQQAITGVVSAGKSGGANVRLIWDFQPLGAVASPPAVPSSGTAYTNQFWRDAVVIVSGGTVTAIAVDGKTTGLTSGAIFVRNGGTITLTYSAAPAWNWVLA